MASVIRDPRATDVVGSLHNRSTHAVPAVDQISKGEWTTVVKGCGMHGQTQWRYYPDEIPHRRFFGGEIRSLGEMAGDIAMRMREAYSDARAENDPVAMSISEPEAPVLRPLYLVRPEKLPVTRRDGVTLEDAEKVLADAGIPYGAINSRTVFVYQVPLPYRLREEHLMTHKERDEIAAAFGLSGKDISQPEVGRIILAEFARRLAVNCHLMHHRLGGTFSDRYGTALAPGNITLTGHIVDLDVSWTGMSDGELAMHQNEDIEWARDSIQDMAAFLHLGWQTAVEAGSEFDRLYYAGEYKASGAITHDILADELPLTELPFEIYRRMSVPEVGKGISIAALSNDAVVDRGRLTGIGESGVMGEGGKPFEIIGAGCSVCTFIVVYDADTGKTFYAHSNAEDLTKVRTTYAAAAKEFSGRPNIIIYLSGGMDDAIPLSTIAGRTTIVDKANKAGFKVIRAIPHFSNIGVTTWFDPSKGSFAVMETKYSSKEVRKIAGRGIAPLVRDGYRAEPKPAPVAKLNPSRNRDISYEVVKMDRSFTEERAEDILRLINEVPGSNWDKEKLLEEYPGKWEHSYAAVDKDGAIISILLAYDQQSSEELKIQYPHIFIRRLCTDSEYRKLNIATKLLNRLASDQAKDKYIALQTGVDNKPANGLYRSVGFDNSAVIEVGDHRDNVYIATADKLAADTAKRIGINAASSDSADNEPKTGVAANSSTSWTVYENGNRAGSRLEPRPAPAAKLNPSRNELDIDKLKILTGDKYFLRAAEYFNKEVLGSDITWERVLGLYERFRGDTDNPEYTPLVREERLRTMKGIVAEEADILSIANRKYSDKQALLNNAADLYSFIIENEIFAEPPGPDDGFAEERKLLPGFDTVTEKYPGSTSPASGHHRLAYFIMNYFLINNGYTPFYFKDDEYGNNKMYGRPNSRAIINALRERVHPVVISSHGQPRGADGRFGYKKYGNWQGALNIIVESFRDAAENGVLTIADYGTDPRAQTVSESTRRKDFSRLVQYGFLKPAKMTRGRREMYAFTDLGKLYAFNVTNLEEDFDYDSIIAEFLSDFPEYPQDEESIALLWRMAVSQGLSAEVMRENFDRLREMLGSGIIAASDVPLIAELAASEEPHAEDVSSIIPNLQTMMEIRHISSRDLAGFLLPVCRPFGSSRSHAVIFVMDCLDGEVSRGDIAEIMAQVSRYGTPVSGRLLDVIGDFLLDGMTKEDVYKYFIELLKLNRHFDIDIPEAKLFMDGAKVGRERFVEFLKPFVMATESSVECSNLCETLGYILNDGSADWTADEMTDILVPIAVQSGPNAWTLISEVDGAVKAGIITKNEVAKYVMPIVKTLGRASAIAFKVYEQNAVNREYSDLPPIMRGRSNDNLFLFSDEFRYFAAATKDRTITAEEAEEALVLPLLEKVPPFSAGEDEPVIITVLRTLRARIENATPRSAERVQALIGELYRSEDNFERMHLVRQLAASGFEAALKALKALYENPNEDPFVRKTIAKNLDLPLPGSGELRDIGAHDPGTARSAAISLAEAGIRAVHEDVRLYLRSDPFPDGSKIIISSDLLDPVDAAALNSVSEHIEVMSPKDARSIATRSDGSVSKSKIACIVSRAEFGQIWQESHKAGNKATVIVLDDSDLKERNYLYLELLVGFARAAMAGDPLKIKAFGSVLFTDEISDSMLEELKEDNPIKFTQAVLKFRPPVAVDVNRLEDYKKMVSEYLVMA